MKPILFLDDNVNRTRAFQSRVPPAICVETAADMIDLIQKHDEIDHIFLDHDLGNEVWVDSSRVDCGMEVVRWLVKNDRRANIECIVVHSHNTPAAVKMHADLMDAGYSVRVVPFASLLPALNYSPGEALYGNNL